MFAQFQMIYWAHEHWTVSIARIMRTTHWRRARGQTIAFVKRHTIVLLYRHTTVFVQRNTIVYVQRSTKILNLNDSNILGACCKPIIDQILVTAPSSGWPLVISCPPSSLYHRFISGSLYTAHVGLQLYVPQRQKDIKLASAVSCLSTVLTCIIINSYLWWGRPGPPTLHKWDYEFICAKDTQRHKTSTGQCLSGLSAVLTCIIISYLWWGRLQRLIKSHRGSICLAPQPPIYHQSSYFLSQLWDFWLEGQTRMRGITFAEQIWD